jgi:hypothetical protein
MHQRAFAVIAIPLALAACEGTPSAPEERTGEEIQVGTVSMNLTDARRLALSAALADVRVRLLPALAETGAPLGAALERMDRALATDDAAAVLEASSAVESALGVAAGEDADAVLVELDAIRLMLGEMRLSAGDARSIQIVE